jgi:hypothetical protein
MGLFIFLVVTIITGKKFCQLHFCIGDIFASGIVFAKPLADFAIINPAFPRAGNIQVLFHLSIIKSDEGYM